MMIPYGVDLPTWAASLIIDFPQEIVPILYNAELWKDWGNTLLTLESFSAQGIPGTESYDNWQGWANVFYYAMANSA